MTLLADRDLSVTRIFDANRAKGRVAFSVETARGLTLRKRVQESGSLRVRFPNVSGPDCEAVLVNTGGGMTGGDSFDIAIALEAKAALTVTTAAAEKIYRSTGPDATLTVDLTVGAGAALAWLPQETILFNGARLARRITVDLADDASLLMVEGTVFGRSGMDEEMTRGFLHDQWLIRRGGRLIHLEATRLDENIAARLARRAVAHGAAAVATLLAVPAAQTVAAIRGSLHRMRGEVGASEWNGLAVARFVAPDGGTLRHDLMQAVMVTRVAGLPRLWLQ